MTTETNNKPVPILKVRKRAEGDKGTGSVPIEKRGNIFYIKLENVIADPEMDVRYAPPDDTTLYNSIKKYGQQEPIKCTRGKDKKAHIVFGFTRHRVLTRLNQEFPGEYATIAVVFETVDTGGDETDTYMKALGENEARTPMGPLDYAKVVMHMRTKFNWSVEIIADKLGYSVQWVYRMLNIAKIPEDLKEKIGTGEGKISVDVALALNKDPGTSIEEAKEIIQEVVEEKKADKEPQPSIENKPVEPPSIKKVLIVVDEDDVPSDNGKATKPSKRAAMTMKDLKKRKGVVGPSAKVVKKMLAGDSVPANAWVFVPRLIAFMEGAITQEEFLRDAFKTAAYRKKH